MDLLALRGRASADEMELDERVDEFDEMELDERGNEDGGLHEMQLVRSVDGIATPRARAATAEQKRVREMHEDNAEKCRLARNKLQRVIKAAGAMTDGTTLSIGSSDGLDLDKWDSEVNAPAYALVLPLTRAILPSAHDLLAAAAATEAKYPSSISARLLS
jgi:hypothetical protein